MWHQLKTRLRPKTRTVVEDKGWGQPQHPAATDQRGAEVVFEGTTEGQIIITLGYACNSEVQFWEGCQEEWRHNQEQQHGRKVKVFPQPVASPQTPASCQCPHDDTAFPSDGIFMKSLPHRSFHTQQPGQTLCGNVTGTVTSISPTHLSPFLKLMDFKADISTPPEVFVIITKAFEVINSGWLVKNDCRNIFP